jgi:hypothetical protein
MRQATGFSFVFGEKPKGRFGKPNKEKSIKGVIRAA